MKKLFTLMLALSIGIGLKAQCPLTQAVDFTATDCHGTEVHLFDILDGGQAVLIDFFFANCGPCQQATPKVVESYYAMGCNMHDVFYMEISDRDSDAVCQTWCQNYGVEYPTIGGTAGGAGICNTYQIRAFPTVILIMPDRSIVIQDLWPINNAQTIISALEQHGLQQHDCNAPSYDPQVTITVDQVNFFEVTATFTPNADCASYGYTIATEAEIQEWMALSGFDDLGEYLWNYGIPGSGTLSNTFNNLTPDTEYVIYAVPADPDGNLGAVVQEPVVTTPSGTVDIIPDFNGTDIDGNEIHLYDILDGGQYVLINFFLTGDGGGADIMPYMTESYRMFGCNAYDVFYMEFTPNAHDDAARAWAEQYGVEYPTISRDGGANDFVQEIPVGWYPTVMLINPNHEIVIRDLYPIIDTQSIVDALEGEGIEQHDCGVGLEETEGLMTITLYPNPANDFVILKGEDLGTVRIYNALGQKVDEFEATDELNINTAGYGNGVYVVKMYEKTLRFVVKH